MHGQVGHGTYFQGGGDSSYDSRRWPWSPPILHLSALCHLECS